MRDCPEALDTPLASDALDTLHEVINAMYCEKKGDYPTQILTIRNTLLTNFLLQTRPKQGGAQAIDRLAQQTCSSISTDFNPDDVLG